MDPGVGDFQGLVGEFGLGPSTNADLGGLLGLIISQQVGDVVFACGSASAALDAVLGGQAAPPVSGPCEGAQMPPHSAANACVCNWGGDLKDEGGLVEAAAAIAGLLVAEHCRCPATCMQGALCNGPRGAPTRFGRAAAGCTDMHGVQWGETCN